MKIIALSALIAFWLGLKHTTHLRIICLINQFKYFYSSVCFLLICAFGLVITEALCWFPINSFLPNMCSGFFCAVRWSLPMSESRQSHLRAWLCEFAACRERVRAPARGKPPALGGVAAPERVALWLIFDLLPIHRRRWRGRPSRKYICVYVNRLRWSG
jgi:hypothetical protein